MIKTPFNGINLTELSRSVSSRKEYNVKKVSTAPALSLNITLKKLLQTSEPQTPGKIITE